MSNENLDRSNPTKFVQYMQENPFYFQDIFKQPFSFENANSALKEMGLYGFVGVFAEPKKPIIHRKRIEKKSKIKETSTKNATLNLKKGGISYDIGETGSGYD